MSKEQLLEKLDNLNFKEHTTDYIYYYLCGVAEEIGARDFSGHFVSYEKLDNIVRDALDEYGVYGVKIILDGIMDLSHKFYYKEDNSKLRNVNKNDLELWRYELKVCIEEL